MATADIPEAIVDDPFFQEDLEYLPGDWAITYGQLKKYRDLKDFFVFDSDGKKHFIVLSPDDYEAFPYYYRIWDDWHHFHVFPEGKGTSAELPWYLDFIKYFDKVWREVELYRQRRASGGNN